MALKFFFIQVKGKVSGPLSGSELMSLAQLGKLLPTDMVRQDGSDKWDQAITGCGTCIWFTSGVSKRRNRSDTWALDCPQNHSTSC